MKIPVVFANGSLGVVCGEDLDEMLDKKRIVAFQRSSGLAVVGRDEIRDARGGVNGSWRDRKSNRRPREETMFLPQRTIFQPLPAYMMTKKEIEVALFEELPIAADQR